MNFSIAQLLDQAQAVELRQHDVNHRRVVRRRGRQRQAVFAIGGVVHGEAALLQPLDDKRGDLFVVLNDQDAHVATFCSAASDLLSDNFDLWAFGFHEFATRNFGGKKKSFPAAERSARFQRASCAASVPRCDARRASLATCRQRCLRYGRPPQEKLTYFDLPSSTTT